MLYYIGRNFGGGKANGTVFKKANILVMHSCNMQ